MNGDQLKPEETTNKKVGAKFDIANGLAMTVSVFDMKRTKILMDDPTNIRFSVDAGTQRTKTPGLSMSGDLGNGWSAYAGDAWLKSEIVSSPLAAIVGNTSPLIPKNSGNIWLKRDCGSGFYVAGGARYGGERYTSLTNVVSLGSYTTAQLSGGYSS